MDLRSWILAEHDQLLFSYQVTAGLVPPDRWAVRPTPGSNPVAWLVWHVARWEDLAVNVMVRDAVPVLDDAWSRRLGLAPAPGTGFTDDDVDHLAATVDPADLDAYWHAVHEHTRQWLIETDTDELERLLDADVDTDARYAASPGLFPDRASWVYDFQRGKTGEFFLRWVAIGHANWHFGELQTVTTALGYPVG